jgi:hypothetical protein
MNADGGLAGVDGSGGEGGCYFWAGLLSLLGRGFILVIVVDQKLLTLFLMGSVFGVSGGVYYPLKGVKNYP